MRAAGQAADVASGGLAMRAMLGMVNLVRRVASGLSVMLRPASILALMLVGAACGAQPVGDGRPHEANATGGEGGRAPPGTAIEPDPSPAPAGGRSLRVRPLPSNPPVPGRAGFWVVRDEDEWHGAEAPVDFDGELVLIASAGMGSGETMTVMRAVAVEGALHVTVAHALPGRGCPTLDVDRWVGQAVAIERTEGPVHVHVERRQAPPCLDEPVAALECWTATRPQRRAGSVRSIEPVTVHCDASESRTDGGRGEPERWSWRVVSAPEDSEIEEGAFGEGPEVRIETDVPGTYAWEVTITDAGGNQASAQGAAVIGPVGRSFDVTVLWESQNGEAVEAPLVVEVRRDGAVCALDADPKPPWCVTRALGDYPGFPSIVQLSANARGRFRIAVRYPEGRPEHGVAKITLAPDGTPTHILRDDRPREAGSRMPIGTVRMPRGTFTPADRAQR